MSRIPRFHYYLSTDHLLGGALRGLYRLFAFFMIFAAMAILVLAVRALIPTRIGRRISPAVRRFAGTQIYRAAGVRIARSGTLPPDISLVVSNHLSWLDAVVYLAELGPRFVAKSSWESIPFLGPALRAAGVIFVTRSRLRDVHRVGHRLSRFASSGELAMMFPEATTTRGEHVEPFRAGLLEPAAAENLAVGWAALRYETPPGWPPGSVVAAWGDWTPLLLHVYRAFHPPRVTARIVYGSEAVRGSDRKELAAALRRRITEAYVPMERLSDEELKLITVPPPGAVERF